MPIQTQCLAVDGGRIAYDVDGSGPLVVCVPGLGDLRSSFRFFAPRLVDAGYRVATMDLRGHGDSDATFDRYDDVATSGDILALIEHLGGGEPAIVTGNSLGGAAAAYAAAEKPAAIGDLVLLGAFLRDPAGSRLITLMQRALLMRPWGPRAWNAYWAGLFKDDPPADLAEQRAAIRRSLARRPYWTAFVATTRTSHRPVADRLGDVRTAALVVMGTKDPDFRDPAAEAQWGVDRIGGQVVMVHGAGHYPHVEQPDRVADATIAYLRGDRADA